MAEAGWRQRLSEAVEKSGRSERAISLAAGCGHGYLNSILNTEKDPTLPRLVKICAELKVSLTYIVLGIEQTPTQERLLMLLSELPEAQQEAFLRMAESISRGSGQT